MRGRAVGAVWQSDGVKKDFHTSRFQNLEEGNPIDSGGLHRHRLNASALQPIGEPLEIFGEGLETANGFWVVIGRKGHIDLPGANVDAGGVRPKHRAQKGLMGFSFFRLIEGVESPISWDVAALPTARAVNKRATSQTGSSAEPDSLSRRHQ